MKRLLSSLTLAFLRVVAVSFLCLWGTAQVSTFGRTWKNGSTGVEVICYCEGVSIRLVKNRNTPACFFWQGRNISWNSAATNRNSFPMARKVGVLIAVADRYMQFGIRYPTALLIALFAYGTIRWRSRKRPASVNLAPTTTVTPG